MGLDLRRVWLCRQCLSVLNSRSHPRPQAHCEWAFSDLYPAQEPGRIRIKGINFRKKDRSGYLFKETWRFKTLERFAETQARLAKKLNADQVLVAIGRRQVTVRGQKARKKSKQNTARSAVQGYEASSPIFSRPYLGPFMLGSVVVKRNIVLIFSHIFLIIEGGL